VLGASKRNYTEAAQHRRTHRRIWWKNPTALLLLVDENIGYLYQPIWEKLGAICGLILLDNKGHDKNSWRKLDKDDYQWPFLPNALVRCVNIRQQFVLYCPALQHSLTWLISMQNLVNYLHCSNELMMLRPCLFLDRNAPTCHYFTKK
jgi:hypothetical protein